MSKRIFGFFIWIFVQISVFPFVKPLLAETPSSNIVSESISNSLKMFSNGSRNVKKVALTFDACPTLNKDQYDEKIVDILVGTKTPATIFISGSWMKKETEHVKYLASLPQFELGNHSYYHQHLLELTNEKVKNEINKTQNLFFKIFGFKPKLFRPPFGEYDDRIVNIVSQLNLTGVDFDLASGDPDEKFTKEVLIKYITKHAKNGSIILMHINKKGWHTAEALETIIQNLRDKGFTLVKVSELIDDLQKEKSKIVKGVKENHEDKNKKN